MSLAMHILHENIGLPDIMQILHEFHAFSS